MEPKNLTARDKKEPVKKVNMQYQRDKEREIVTGIAKNYECPGGVIEFVYKKYKGDQVEKYSFRDGEVCKIPLGVARHMNTDCWYPIHANTMDENGKYICKVGTKVRRFGFQSLEFLDDNDLNDYGASSSSLVTVERVSLAV